MNYTTLIILHENSPCPLEIDQLVTVSSQNETKN